MIHKYLENGLFLRLKSAMIGMVQNYGEKYQETGFKTG